MDDHELRNLLDVGDPEVKADRAVLSLLYDARPSLLSTAEITRAVGENAIDIEDSLARLHGASLIHHVDDFWWVSRTARIAGELDFM